MKKKLREKKTQTKSFEIFLEFQPGTIFQTFTIFTCVTLNFSGELFLQLFVLLILFYGAFHCLSRTIHCFVQITGEVVPSTNSQKNFFFNFLLDILLKSNETFSFSLVFSSF